MNKSVNREGERFFHSEPCEWIIVNGFSKFYIKKSVSRGKKAAREKLADLCHFLYFNYLIFTEYLLCTKGNI